MNVPGADRGRAGIVTVMFGSVWPTIAALQYWSTSNWCVAWNKVMVLARWNVSTRFHDPFDTLDE